MEMTQENPLLISNFNFNLILLFIYLYIFIENTKKYFLAQKILERLRKLQFWVKKSCNCLKINQDLEWGFVIFVKSMVIYLSSFCQIYGNMFIDFDQKSVKITFFVKHMFIGIIR